MISYLFVSSQYCVSKLTVLELLLKIAHHVGDDIILERLLPYILYLVNDPLPQVRAQALKILSQCLQLVRSMPRSDANIFPEYVLPSLSWLTQDQEVIVRIAYAENIASLAETALKFLEMAQLDFANQESNDDDDAPIQYQVNASFSSYWALDLLSIWFTKIFLVLYLIYNVSSVSSHAY